MVVAVVQEDVGEDEVVLAAAEAAEVEQQHRAAVVAQRVFRNSFRLPWALRLSKATIMWASRRRSASRSCAKRQVHLWGANVSTPSSLTLSVDGGANESHLRRALYAPGRGSTESRAIPGRVQSHGAADQCAQVCKLKLLGRGLCSRVAYMWVPLGDQEVRLGRGESGLRHAPRSTARVPGGIQGPNG